MDLDLTQEISFTELECYQNIIADKINGIVLGTDNYLNSLADKYKIDIEKIISILISVFETGDEFSYLKILNNRLLLSLMLSLTYFEDWLKGFFQNTYVSKSDYPEVDFYSEFFDWNDRLPLASIYEMIYLKIRSSIEDSPSQNQSYRLYDMYKGFTYKEDEYKLPEGIRVIHRLKDKYEEKREFEIFDSLFCEFREKTIKMPSTLKSIRGDFFKFFYKPSVIFNDEFEEFQQDSLCSIDRFCVPNGVKVIDKDAFRSNSSIVIEICDYKNSNLLNNEKLFKNFIKNCYFAQKTSKQRRHYISDETRRKQELYATSRYSFSDHSYLFDHDCTYTTFEFRPKFNKLLIEDENGDGIILNLVDLTCEYERCSLEFGFDSEYLLGGEVYTVMEHIKEKIAQGFAERNALISIVNIRNRSKKN